jgi:mono/diheme cytochrome c family protein
MDQCMKTRARFAWLLVGFCFWTTAEPAPSSTLALGESLYQQHCAVCHGQQGRPDTAAGRLLAPRPRVFSDPVDMARVSFEQMYGAIKEGRPGTAMAPWNTVLTDLQIGAVIDYIFTFLPESSRSAPYEASVALGRRLYRARCVVCHGDTGRADTEAARMLDPPPTDFTDPVAMARVDDGRMYLAITKGVPGTAMSSWEHAMVPAEVIDIMRYVRTLERSLPAGMSRRDLDLTVGGNIYEEHCIVCHGAEGKGRTLLMQSLGRYPMDFSDTKAMRAVSDDVLRQTILNGRPGTAMAPWQGILNEEDVRRLILFIRRTFQRSS